jgi:hypothetical protein
LSIPVSILKGRTIKRIKGVRLGFESYRARPK